MAIVLNEKAKQDLAKTQWDFKGSRLLQNIAKQQKLTGMDKANLIFNLGIVYAMEESEGAKEHILRSTNLDHALSWDDTPQGFGFWANLYEKLSEN